MKKEATTLFIFHLKSDTFGKNTQRFENVTNIKIDETNYTFDYISEFTGKPMKAWFNMRNISGFSMSTN